MTTAVSQTSRGSVYLVDDHALLRDGVRVLLVSRGFDVVGEADTPTLALQEILQLRPDLLLLDLRLGSDSGLALLERLQKHGASVRTVVLTVDAQAFQVAKAHRLGVEGFVFKYEPPTTLLQAIHRVMQNEHHWAPRALELLASADKGSRLARLSPREAQIIRLVVEGCSSTEIGAHLHLSPKTVDTYRSRLMAKLEVGDVPSLVRLAIREGMIGP